VSSIWQGSRSRRGSARATLSLLGAPVALTVSAALAPAPAPAATGEEMLLGFSDGSPIFPYEGSPGPRRLAGLERRAGAEAGRFTIRWEEVQPKEPPLIGPPSYRWDRIDALVSALRDRGIQPLPMLLGAPAWARDPRCSGICPPAAKHMPEWRQFVNAVAARYRGEAAIEIWNEPNLAAYWVSDAGPDPAAYARLYGNALRATLLTAPRTPILVGGLALAEQDAVAEGSMPLETWLRGFYAAARNGAANLLDPRVAIGLHVYPGPAELDAPIEDGRLARTLAEARSAIAAGDPLADRRRIWITETGASTTAPGPDGTPITPEQQASAIGGTLDALEAAPDVAAALVYTVVERPPSSDPGEAGFGVVGRGPEFVPKPAYCALALRWAGAEPRGC
jgi:polysaccharide biosynthesis protein PslG